LTPANLAEQVAAVEETTSITPVLTALDAGRRLFVTDNVSDPFTLTGQLQHDNIF
jgi:hypothetical protein